MTLDLQVALPDGLVRRIEEVAATRGLPVGDFLTLLVGVFSSPELRLSEDRVTRDLSDELMLHFQRNAARLERASGKTLDLLPDLSLPKPTPEEIHAELSQWRTPQSLDELRPRVPPPPGITAMQFIRGQWPGDETDTDEDILASLKAMG